MGIIIFVAVVVIIFGGLVSVANCLIGNAQIRREDKKWLEQSLRDDDEIFRKVAKQRDVYYNSVAQGFDPSRHYDGSKK